jgi:3'-phosphoadenosine 5'-phosphosulfate sulfotransferase (PAPS reductase)/FAD synthetase
MHSAIMKLIKYNTMKKFIQEPEFRNKHPAIVGGVRKFESVRRFGSYNTPITQETDLWFVNPIFYETQEEVYKYFIENGLKRSPTYETLGFSGECMCGSFASVDEAIMLKRVDPKLFEFIEWITEGIKKFGSSTAKRYSKWGDSADFDEVKNQELLEVFFNEDELEHLDKMAINTCGSECGASTMKGMTDF